MENPVLYNKKLEPTINKLIYEPLRTIKECNHWAQTYLRIPHVDYTGFDINIANKINRQIQIMKNLYPEIKTVRWINNIARSVPLYANETETGKKLLNECDNDMNNLIEDFSYGTIALTLNEDCKYQGIWFDLENIKDIRMFYKKFHINIKTRYFAVGKYEIEHTVTHEFAHHIEDYLISKKMFGYIERVWKDQHKNIKSRKKRRLKAKITIQKKLCKYAAEDVSEFFAEAMAEYIHNPEPRELAMRIGKETQSIFDTFRLQNTAK